MTGWEGPHGTEFLKPAGKDQPREGEKESRGEEVRGQSGQEAQYRQVGLQEGKSSEEETITKISHRWRTRDKVHADRGPEKGGAAHQRRPLSTPNAGDRGGQNHDTDKGLGTEMASTRLPPALESEDRETSPLNYRTEWFPTNISCPARGGWRKTLSDMSLEMHLLCILSQKAPRDVLRWNEGISQERGEHRAQEGETTWEAAKEDAGQGGRDPGLCEHIHDSLILQTVHIQHRATGSHIHTHTHTHFLFHT